MNKTIVIGLIESWLHFTACTEEQVTSTIIGVGVGIGAIANDRDRHERHQELDRYIFI
ncbi:MAG: hypothetical protein H7326_04725 [Bdellovibrionaceae bacterium]|nr:hypothetical protein [Pseudobdellovibrionaceae bacterium]